MHRTQKKKSLHVIKRKNWMTYITEHTNFNYKQIDRNKIINDWQR